MFNRLCCRNHRTEQYNLCREGSCQRYSLLFNHNRFLGKVGRFFLSILRLRFLFVFRFNFLSDDGSVFLTSFGHGLLFVFRFSFLSDGGSGFFPSLGLGLFFVFGFLRHSRIYLLDSRSYRFLSGCRQSVFWGFGHCLIGYTNRRGQGIRCHRCSSCAENRSSKLLLHIGYSNCEGIAVIVAVTGNGAAHTHRIILQQAVNHAVRYPKIF